MFDWNHKESPNPKVIDPFSQTKGKSTEHADDRCIQG